MAELEKINGRKLTSLFLGMLFAVMALSGVISFVMPQGRIAYWVDWRLWWLSREQWVNLHSVSGLVFFVVGSIHLVYNWRPFVAYLRRTGRQLLLVNREVAIAAVAIVALGAGTLASAPPFRQLVAWQESVKGLWLSDPAAEPPFGHAELLSLRVFAKRQGIALQPALATLRAAGIRVVDAGATLQGIAHANGIAPVALYALIKPLEPEVEAVVGLVTSEQVEERFAGSGLGRKSLAQVCTDVALPLDEAKRRLAAQGWTAADDETFKAIADRFGVTPIDVLKAILVPGYQRQ